MRPLDILCMGEPLMEFAEVQRGGETLYLPGFGGDTSNAAIAAARQGASVGFFSALGDDAFGRDFLNLWDAEGIDRSSCFIRDGGRTGIYFIRYSEGRHGFSYFREGSAASLVKAGDIPLEQIENSRILHASGISQAISPGCADAVFAAIHHAKAAGAVVSYDTNLRLRLWPLDRARAVTHAAVALADIALPALDDARQLTGLGGAEEICGFYLGLGAGMVALTLGQDGAMVATPTELRIVATRRVEPVDATGAGDMFDGAFLAEWLLHRDPFRAAAYANAAAALSTLGHGAVAPMPWRADVEGFLSQS